MNSSFAKTLTTWYQKTARDLPWRRTKDPYKIWISEVMLQQTTVNAVIPYFEKWIKTFPTITDLAKTPIQTVLAQWQGLGYYNRAKNLHKSAQIILNEHAAKVPSDPEVVRKLPGFGPYTTGAVLSIAYDRRLPIIDANVRRVVMRILSIDGEADTKQDKRVLEFLLKVLPEKNIGDFNQALMELGALVCRSKEPVCVQCPVLKFCRAYKEGRQEIIPTPKKREIKDIEAVIAIIENNGKYFVQKRPAKGLLADLWEFPGGKLEVGESHEGALIREINEELGIKPKSVKHLFDVQHFYTQFRVKLSVWRFEPETLPATDLTHKWLAPKDFHKYPMPSGSAKIVERIFLKKNA
jgi:A/G-specific adenine glycosylase